MAGAPGEGGAGDDQLMNMFKGLLGGLDGAPGGGGEGDQNKQMEDMMKQFSGFLQETEGNDQFKGALDSVVGEILSKDSLHKPMQHLRDAYPDWLEKNWEGLSDDDLERYNKQLDKVTEICELYENDEKAATEKTSSGKDGREDVFELLSQLQELGHPPEELMKQIQEAQGGAPNLGLGPGIGGTGSGGAAPNMP